MLSKILSGTFLLSILSTSIMADEHMNGKTLTQANCTRCHGTEVYTRPNHRMQNLAQLNTQVRRCNSQLGTQLFDEDMDAIATHLNSAYYKFK